jgi:hypothetical protein
MRRKINEIIELEEGIAMASELLKRISKDHAERLEMMSIEKHQLDIQSKLVTAERKGIKKGEQRGEQRGIVMGEQRIINMLDSGKSLEEIKKIIGSAN